MIMRVYILLSNGVSSSIMGMFYRNSAAKRTTEKEDKAPILCVIVCLILRISMEDNSALGKLLRNKLENKTLNLSR